MRPRLKGPEAKAEAKARGYEAKAEAEAKILASRQFGLEDLWFLIICLVILVTSFVFCWHHDTWQRFP